MTNCRMQTLVCNQCSLYSVRTFGWPPYNVELQTAEPGIELHISGKVRRLQMAKAEVWLQSFKWPFNPSLLSVTVSTVILSYVSQIKRNCAISYLHPSSFLTLDVVGKITKLSRLLHWLLLWDNRQDGLLVYWGNMLWAQSRWPIWGWRHTALRAHSHTLIPDKCT